MLYNYICDNPVFARKESAKMEDRKKVKGTLSDNRGIWTVHGRVYDPFTGSVVQRSKSTGLYVKDHTRRKAEQMMKAIVEAWDKEANVRVTMPEPLFSTYIQKWLETADISKRANTALSYRNYANKYIIPMIGDMKVGEVTRRVVQDFVNDLCRSHSPNSVKKYMVVVNGALDDALADGWIQINPGKNNIRFPKAKKFEGKAYSPEQVRLLLEAAECEGEPIRSAVILAVVYGLRRSEICGLRWKDIDFDTSKLYVRCTRTQNGSLILDGENTKTESGRRVIDLVPSTVPYLRDLKKQNEQRKVPSEKVCSWPDGRAVDPNCLTRKTARLMKKAGLEKIRLHDLRHTAATLLSRSATPKQVQSFLGHSNIKETMDVYTHLLDEDREKISGIMDIIIQKDIFQAVPQADQEN